ncbi:hypothetical protein L1049_018938 [Liquidambar formosana]|uniref:SAP30-binding protein n=1 Tax=Liquidambar formosana TaxID=63359 RepID=A0AAP0RAR1_LIQFO
MASKKKESTGIALLSMYNDEDDEMEDLNEEEEEEDDDEVDDDRNASNTDEDMKNYSEGVVGSDNTPQIQEDNSTPKTTKFGSFTPQQTQLSLSSPQLQPQLIPVDSGRSRKERLTIVDYGHDEFAMSPEAEEGEIVSGGRVTFGVELQNSNGDFQEKSPPGRTQVLTPSTQATPQSSEQLDTSQADAMNYHASESEAVGEKCSDELQEKINKFLSYKKRVGKSFNAEVRNKKDYRNPDFLLHAVRYQDIDQIGSCFSKDVFDPHGYDKSDYYDEIAEADMKREMERKEQEKKKSQKVDFVAGGMQPGTVSTAPKINMPIPGVSTMAASGLHSVPSAADAVVRDSRQNKKSKWDKVDGDRRNTLPSGGQDSMSNVGAHAALLSAANAGAGYTAFAQQRRREAEEKRSSERKLDRRS